MFLVQTQRLYLIFLLKLLQQVLKLIRLYRFLLSLFLSERTIQPVNNLKEGDVLLVENTRFEDVDGKKESKNDPELGKYWASLGDVFVNDAFGTAHREHASNVLAI